MNGEEMTIDRLIEERAQQTLASEIRRLEQILNDLLKRANQYPPYMNIKKACEYLSVSRGTLNKFIREDGLPITVIDGIKLISKSDLDEFMLKHRN
ncbi:helix-turn-helix domain-containing protein [Vagococcus fluvialis]|uniref:Helix-turn-helix domain-containing protein n=1 Tax=Vagococcus fluvialis TaxID=2738 RepID=A0A7X6DAL2_9ENTE|nr:helix-turn-helix domain-containing protein [Vagococcus fluvialis]NKC68866.1 helix-turn-helix domain-containing protein [Vagococcus fluvialis]